jgi:hypothetical protein
MRAVHFNLPETADPEAVSTDVSTAGSQYVSTCFVRVCVCRHMLSHIQAGADANAKDAMGLTAVEVALASGNVSTAAALLPATTPLPEVTPWDLSTLMSHVKTKLEAAAAAQPTGTKPGACAWVLAGCQALKCLPVVMSSTKAADKELMQSGCRLVGLLLLCACNVHTSSL